MYTCTCISLTHHRSQGWAFSILLQCLCVPCIVYVVWFVVGEVILFFSELVCHANVFPCTCIWYLFIHVHVYAHVLCMCIFTNSKLTFSASSHDGCGGLRRNSACLCFTSLPFLSPPFSDYWTVESLHTCHMPGRLWGCVSEPHFVGIYSWRLPPLVVGDTSTSFSPLPPSHSPTCFLPSCIPPPPATVSPTFHPPSLSSSPILHSFSLLPSYPFLFHSLSWYPHCHPSPQLHSDGADGC